MRLMEKTVHHLPCFSSDVARARKRRTRHGAQNKIRKDRFKKRRAEQDAAQDKPRICFQTSAHFRLGSHCEVGLNHLHHAGPMMFTSFQILQNAIALL